jgi:DNA-binding transcriptional regulator GbsR (MarR family)
VVRRIRRAGDRREYFEAETDVWKMISRVLRERELTQIERTLEVFERVREKLRTLPLPGERLRLDDIAERLGKLVDLARVGRGLLVALVQQGRVDLGPLMRFARPRRGG